ncbi:MAG: rod shape-determining protein RodA [Chloroflexi bacterium]|nr:MAG: rod shape-determining protein RodA [Chloroflexota bacterium]HDN79105.1 rod shape-determining protein RodA [Chloroflexota bacterium]
MGNWHDFDFILFGCTLILVVTGVAMVYSATIGVEGLETLARQQAIYAVLGMMVMLLFALIDYRFLEHFAWLIYAIALAMLAAVLIKGEMIYGAQRWLKLGPVQFQPSEPAKLLITIALAAYLAGHKEEINRFRHVMFSLIMVGIPCLLIYMQPDLGTAITLVVIWLVMMWAAGIRFHHLAFLGFSAIAALPFIWMSLKDYMRHRILIFLNPHLDPGTTYNLEQALISIGSGGFLGKGFAKGSQSQLHFLRVRHTDFIFSVIGEELGFLGAILVLLLLFLVIWRMLRAAYLARDPLGSLLAVGLGSLTFFQVLVNVGMNMGIMPVTGIPLPFISSGGSALITLLAGEGLVQSVLIRRKKIEFK